MFGPTTLIVFTIAAAIALLAVVNDQYEKRVVSPRRRQQFRFDEAMNDVFLLPQRLRELHRLLEESAMNYGARFGPRESAEANGRVANEALDLAEQAIENGLRRPAVRSLQFCWLYGSEVSRVSASRYLQKLLTEVLEDDPPSPSGLRHDGEPVDITTVPGKLRSIAPIAVQWAYRDDFFWTLSDNDLYELVSQTAPYEELIVRWTASDRTWSPAKGKFMGLAEMFTEPTVRRMVKLRMQHIRHNM